MRAVVQRVRRARVTVADAVCGEIGLGFCVLVGIAVNDEERDADQLAAKIAGLRIFPDGAGAMNHALLEENGVIIWLDCPFSKVCARVDGTSHRPLARDAAKFKQLYEDRRDAYRKADHRIEIDTDDPAAGRSQ